MSTDLTTAPQTFANLADPETAGRIKTLWDDYALAQGVNITSRQARSDALKKMQAAGIHGLAARIVLRVAAVGQLSSSEAALILTQVAALASLLDLDKPAQCSFDFSMPLSTAAMREARRAARAAVNAPVAPVPLHIPNPPLPKFLQDQALDGKPRLVQAFWEGVQMRRDGAPRTACKRTGRSVPWWEYGYDALDAAWREAQGLHETASANQPSGTVLAFPTSGGAPTPAPQTAQPARIAL